MRQWMIVMIVALSVCFIAGFATNATAGDQVSPQMLAQMGLSGMQPMSDQEGMGVRGMGYAYVWGSSTVNLFNSSANDNYGAGTAHFFGPSVAAGGTARVLVAGGAVVVNPPGPFNTFGAAGIVGVGTIGGAFAFSN